MTDDRADRIRRMREGRRGDEDADDTAEAEATTDATEAPVDDATTADGASDAGSVPTDAADAVEAAVAAAEAATDDDGAASATADASDLDDEVAAAVEGLDVPDDAGTSVESVVEELADDETADADDGATEATDPTETVSVLEFVLGDERYCLDISYIEQIVERGTVTRIPNAPHFVDGVIDLRGDITTVIDPKSTVETDDDGDGDLIVVFDSTEMDDEWSVGWAVDAVRRVSTVSLDEVKESPVDEPWINGIVKRDEDGEFVIWTEPGELMRIDEDRSGV
jgi:purine-binding chemotaxis protein CheW